MKKIVLLVICLSIFNLTGCDKDLKCPEEYELKDRLCLKEIDHQDAEEEKICAEGFTLKDDKCYKLEEVAYQEKYTCPEDLTLEGTKCTGTLKKALSTQYKCEDGTLEDKKCIILTEMPDTLVKTANCESGWTVDGNYCIKGEMPPLDCEWENGDHEGCRCEGSDVLGSDGLCHNAKAVTYTYSCLGIAILKDNKCYEKSSVDAESYQGCEEEYTKEDNNCVKKINENATKEKLCDEGFELVNDKCKKETITNVKIEYHCKDDYEYVDKLCRKNEKTEAKK